MVSVSGFGRPKSHFLHLKTATLIDLGRKKNGDHFLSPTNPKNGGIDFCFTRISFSGEFWANFENRVFLAHFWPISHCKIVNCVRAISQETNGRI